LSAVRLLSARAGQASSLTSSTGSSRSSASAPGASHAGPGCPCHHRPAAASATSGCVPQKPSTSPLARCEGGEHTAGGGAQREEKREHRPSCPARSKPDPRGGGWRSSAAPVDARLLLECAAAAVASAPHAAVCGWRAREQQGTRVAVWSEMEIAPARI
jgi:hypothetical protein